MRPCFIFSKRVPSLCPPVQNCNFLESVSKNALVCRKGQETRALDSNFSFYAVRETSIFKYYLLYLILSAFDGLIKFKMNISFKSILNDVDESGILRPHEAEDSRAGALRSRSEGDRSPILIFPYLPRQRRAPVDEGYRRRRSSRARSIPNVPPAWQKGEEDERYFSRMRSRHRRRRIDSNWRPPESAANFELSENSYATIDSARYGAPGQPRYPARHFAASTGSRHPRARVERTSGG